MGAKLLGVELDIGFNLWDNMPLNWRNHMDTDKFLISAVVLFFIAFFVTLAVDSYKTKALKVEAYKTCIETGHKATDCATFSFKS